MLSSQTRESAKNVMLASLVFLLMIFAPYAAAYIVTYGGMHVAASLGGRGAVLTFIDIMNTNMNLYSAAVYALFAIPVLLWAWGMRCRAKKGMTSGAEAEAGKEAALTAGTLSSGAAAGAAAGVVADTVVCEDMDASPGLQSDVFETALAHPRYPCGVLSAVSFKIRGIDWRYYAAAAFLAVGMQLVTTLVMIAVTMLLPDAMLEYNTMVQDSGIVDYGFMWVISTLLLPPLVEETGFRGLGLTYLDRAGVPFWMANAFQAMAFGLFHMNLTQGLYTFALGLALGYVARRSKSVAPAMFMHMMYNFMGTLGNSLLYALVPMSDLIAFAFYAVCLVAAFRLISAAGRMDAEVG